MDYFDEEKKEDLDKKLFEASYKKQIKASKRIFKIMGFIFTMFSIFPIIFGFSSLEYEACYMAIPFVVMGVVFILLGFILPEKYSYDAVKRRQNKYGYLNVYEMSAKIIMLEEKIKILESKIRNLEDEIRKIK